MTTLSLEASKKVFEIVGEYETEEFTEEVREPWVVCIPRPNFAELIRVLPKIGEKKKWNAGWGRSGTCLIDVLYNVSIIYMNAPRESEGMAAVETYLMKLL